MENIPTFGGGLKIAGIESTKALTGSGILEAQPAFVELAVREAEVKTGERVERGQRIGCSDMPVYASISGTVRGCRDGRVIINNDFENRMAKPLKRPKNSVDATEYISFMEQIGLKGMGGAGFPTARKYAGARHVSCLLVNGCECEPYITCDRALMNADPGLVIRGAMSLAKATDSAAVFLCVEDEKLCQMLRQEAEGACIRVLTVSEKYPQGSERQLIEAVLRRQVPRFRLPRDCDVTVSNVSTGAAFAESLETGLPPTSRVVTVSGCIERPSNIRVPLGTCVSFLLGLCGGAPQGTVILSGGPMTGKIIDANNTFTDLSTTGFTVLVPPVIKEKQCIRCGGCMRVCPAGIQPYRIDAAERAGDMEAMKKLYSDACISCGCCSYICPAQRELTEHTTQARRLVMKSGAAKEGGR